MCPHPLLHVCNLPTPQIGSHTDDLSFKTTWHRIPTAVSSFPITAAATRAGSPLGGLLYIVVPKGARLGTVRVTVQGAIRAPRFKLGVTSPVRGRHRGAPCSPFDALRGRNTACTCALPCDQCLTEGGVLH